MSEIESTKPLGPNELARRSVTYGALAALAAGFLVMIFWLHSQIASRVERMENRIDHVYEQVQHLEVRVERLETTMIHRFDQIDDALKDLKKEP